MKPAIGKHPKTAFDKTLARIADQKLWELVPACVDFLKQVIEDETQSTRDRLTATKMVLERRIPTLQNVQGIVGHVSIGQGQSVDLDELHRRALEVLSTDGNARGNSDARIH